MGETSETLLKADILEAIHRVELSLVSKMGEMQIEYRNRINDIERRVNLDLREMEARIQKQFADASKDRHSETSERAKAGGQWVMMLVSVMISVTISAVSFLYTRAGH